MILSEDYMQKLRCSVCLVVVELYQAEVENPARWAERKAAMEKEHAECAGKRALRLMRATA